MCSVLVARWNRGGTNANQKIQEIILVCPHDADMARQLMSVLTPVGAALLRLSVKQTISFRTRTGERRELTVLKVSRAV